ncbi:hypothetical protein DDB_G0268562 [Dictyostelium discoideum AX4]|uniref:NADP-dependent oxidoreductase domain-containing protein n=1 Tax=Dictyostelium discoideum TaxID=44689 RepID=Q55FL2_DICDI|nr:hypothetical protein DDB_G0268562 [Dictyostelium discoideum AX4]EAL73734.1 hypothetical protein DDB_G0268562 [Dictyostelium discoideum AX4]|eukprot:XP_647521.1 hypothetical protein DDB_G0268562 [Dictyostelium discoideum AX4]
MILKFLKSVKLKEKIYFIQVWNSCHNSNLVIKHCEKTIEDLGIGYLDLYLIHWPIAFKNANPSDVTIDWIKDENGYQKIAPISIRETWQEMEKLVELAAYSPLSRGKCDFFNNEILKSIADKYKKSVANVIFKWLNQRGIAAIPKSANHSHII